jgi:PAS domain S-box-containing protein
MVLGLDWRITYVNAAAEEACGAPRGQLLGASFWEACVDLAANGELLRKVMSERASVRFESRRSGDRWLEIEAYPLTDGGLACCMRDISKRKRVEEGHRQLQRERDELLAEMQLRFERMPIACAIVGLDGRILDWNPAAEKLLGFSREEALGKNGYELVVAPSARRNARELVARLAQGDMEANGGGENLTKDGRVVFCEWFNTPLRNLDGTVTRFLTMGLDVTAQREVERRLKKNEALMAEAQRLARVGSFSQDIRTDEVSLSDESYRLLGLDPSEGQALTFERVLAAVHPDDAATMKAMIARGLQDHQAFELDWRLLRPDGSVRFVHSRAHVELDEAGVPIRVFGTNQDVTEQKEAEQALIESEARFRALAEASPALIWAVDEEGNVVYINSRYHEMIGISADALMDGTWPAMVHPEDAEATITDFRAALRDRRPFHGRVRVRRYDQRWCWLEYRALPHFGKDGRYLGHVGISFDITEHLELTASLQESEKNAAAELGAMARLQDVSTKLVQTSDSNSLLQDIVNAAIAITAADAGSIQLVEPDGASLRMVASHGLDPAFVEAYCCVRISQGTCGYAMQIGERVIVEDVMSSRLFAGLDMTVMSASGIRAIQSTPLITRSGHLVGMLSTHYRSSRRPADRDLRVLDLLARQAADWIERRMAQVERERLLESERQARAESERAARLKDEFLATLSHELRTPLSAILSWADVLGESLDNRDRVRRGLEVIRRNAWAQAQLIGDLLDLSRVVTGKMRVNIEQVALSAVIDSAIEAVRPAADARAIQIRSAVEPLTAPVHGDPARLRQIMWNLLSNAVKFTPEGGRVDVVLTRVDSWVEIRVTDTGKGISSDFLPYVFERFRQADSSTAREHGGLGIGLALVKQIAELHGGHVRASSPGEGMGSSFVLSLPLSLARGRSAEEEPRAPRAPATSPPFYEVEEPPLDGIKVLVVDDEPDALEVIQHILEDRRAQVATFRNVDAALNALERECFDVLVSDIGMPRRDGYDFIAEVRRRGIKTPAAALSAFARSEDRTRALLSGYQAHLAKPLATSELLATVASLSGRILR